jgi:hypothetical protein
LSLSDLCEDVSGGTLANLRVVSDTELVASDGQPDSRALSAKAVARIAEAFELPRDVVRADAALVVDWPNSEQALRDHLGGEHDWDSSIPPYYLFWLRGDGPHQPELPGV